MDDSTEALLARLRADLKIAMREGRTEDRSLLRTLIAAIDNAQAVPVEEGLGKYEPLAFGDAKAEVARRSLSRQDLSDLLATEAEDRRAAAALYGADAADRSARLRHEAEIIDRYRRD